MNGFMRPSLEVGTKQTWANPLSKGMSVRTKGAADVQLCTWVTNSIPGGAFTQE
jgi:hypothetical protein